MTKIFKTKDDFERFLSLHPVALAVLFDMRLYCFERDLRFQVTSTISTPEEDSLLQRESSTHREARAFDLSVREWSTYQIFLFIEHFNSKYKAYAAISASSGLPVLVLHHDGTAKHLHVQISKRYAIISPSLNETHWEVDHGT